MRKRTPAPAYASTPKRFPLPALAAALGAGLLSLLAPAAHAGGAVYQQHIVNAGVLVNETNTQGSGPNSDPAPYLFYVLNNRADIRPPDLTLVNPLAPTSITSAILNRWTPTAAGAVAPYTQGQMVTPDMAPYWEVPLNSVSDNELSQYNVLYLRADTTTTTFGPAINEKLRRFVDNGGQLIVEYGAASSSTPPPPYNVGLWIGGGAASVSALTSPLTFPPLGVLATPPAPQLVAAPPIVTQPYFLNTSDLTSLFNTIPSGSALSLTANPNDLLHGSEFSTAFSPALMAHTGSNFVPVVSTAQVGAGQVITSALRIGPVVGTGNGAYFLPQTAAPNQTRTPVASDFYNAPAPDLKLLANAIEGLEVHPSENKTSHGNASNAGLASFSPAWQFPVTSTTTAPGAAVWGNFVFVTDAAGTLHAFDAFPSENLTGTADTNGKEQVTTIPAPYYPATSYDEIWNNLKPSNVTLGAGTSAPTVASFSGVNYVFVETANGSVGAFNAVTGQPAPFSLTAPTPPSPYTPASFATGTNAPSPTYYEGRVYAGQANGSLVVYDLSEASGTGAVTGVFVPLNTQPATGSTMKEPVTGPPVVGMITNGDTNVLVAAVSTQYNVYSVLLGARNEPLVPTLVNNALTGYSIDRQRRYQLNNIFADLNAVPPLLAYDSAGNAQTGLSANSLAPNPQDPLFSITNPLGYYTDWNMDFPAAVSSGGGTNASQVNLNFISASSYGERVGGNPPTAATTLSAPAMDRHGDYYYTETKTSSNGMVNSYLVGVSNAPVYSNVHLKFRFLMPTAAVPNQEGVDYTRLNGFNFVGSPVVDDQGNVYALATNGTASTAATLATVLCFRGNQQVTASFDPNGPQFDLKGATITQSDEGGNAEPNTIYAGPDDPTKPTFGQFIPSMTTLSLYNFGHRPPGGQQNEIAGNVTEPSPLTADYTDPNTTEHTMGTLYMRTNLAWYLKPFTVNGPVAGLSQVGSSLFLSDGATLYRVPTKPLVGTGKQVAAAPFEAPVGLGASASGAGAAPLTLGTLGAPPSIGGNVMVLNGSNAIAALTRQVTVIADSNRILGVDGDGGAVWSVDATTRTDLATNFATKVPFSHPTALSQFALNDYLVADTGTNRCVRFDSAGNVQWELTRFSDPSGLMAAGQPLTLSQPSSVVVRTFSDTATLGGTTTLANPGGSYIYYLVADSGHDRILEVVDRVKADGSLFVDANNNTVNHQLTWVTHTGDRDGRNYRYGSADYYTGPILVNNVMTPTLFIAATVVNTRLAPLTATGGLGAVSGDAPGGSLVVFNRPDKVPPFSAGPAAASDLKYAAASFYAATVNTSGTTYTPFAIRNPRFLKLYTPVASSTAPNTNVAPFDFLYADDNGAFDLSFSTSGPGPKGFVAAADRLQFTPTGTNTSNPADIKSYAAMTTPTLGSSTVPQRSRLPFIPTCVQALSTDTQTTANGGLASTTTTTRRYLITQSYSQGELGTQVVTNAGTFGKLGGEVFEIDVSASGITTVTSAQSTPVGGFGGQTLSHPDLTGPLTQPTYAVRLP